MSKRFFEVIGFVILFNILLGLIIGLVTLTISSNIIGIVLTAAGVAALLYLIVNYESLLKNLIKEQFSKLIARQQIISKSFNNFDTNKTDALSFQ
ncbi:hypothetical protein [Spartinivicinus ruber]|uniref:hypothetical protein n=1 Tax=Spartinivicinus ruber TaxID=2683272 RepID=UPI0013D55A14|nr:hypothetical protein [Spartinivicinus ruber]